MAEADGSRLPAFRKPDNLLSSVIIGVWNLIVVFALTAMWLGWSGERDFAGPFVFMALGILVYIVFTVVKVRYVVPVYMKQPKTTETPDSYLIPIEEVTANWKDIHLRRHFVRQRENVLYFGIFSIMSYVVRIIIIGGYVLFSPTSDESLLINLIGFCVSLEFVLFFSIGFLLSSSPLLESDEKTN